MPSRLGRTAGGWGAAVADALREALDALLAELGLLEAPAPAPVPVPAGRVDKPSR